MGGVVSAIGSISLNLLSSLAPNLLLLLPHNRHRQIQQQQQHNDNEVTEIVVVDQEPATLNFCSALLCFSKEEMGRIVSRLLGSILSSLAPNLLLLLPHHHRIQQRNVRSQRNNIVVVDQQPRQPCKTCLLEIAEGEDTIYTINYGPRGMVPLAICHGMFLSKHGYPERLAIWNPTASNKKDMIKTLPQSSVPRPPRVKRELVLVCGFGFDPSSNDYKVIIFPKFLFEDGTNSTLVELYSLKTNSWKKIAYPHGDDVGYGSELVCVYVNGFLYTRANSARLVIIPFDLANDNFPSALIPGPPNNICRSSFALVVFEGSQLGVIAYEYMPFEFELWVWNNDESWSLRGVWANIGDPDIGYIPPAQFFKNDQLFLINSKDELVLFDCAKQSLKVVGVYDDPFVYVFPFNVENESSIN